MKLIAAIMITVLATSCATVKTTNDSVKKRYTKYGIATLPSSWRKESFRNTDLFFQHVNSDATIYISSQCEKFSDSPLEGLTSQMLVGMGKYDITSQHRQKLNDREGLISEVRVDLDGVERYLKIMVLRKNRCVYDAVLSAKESTPDITKDFDDMINGFWAEAEL